MFWKINYFVRDFVSKYGPFVEVLDVGSFNVNGSIRDSFQNSQNPGANITGIDMREGPNVDRVLNGHDILKVFSPNSFDLVTCCETLEHDDKFWLTIHNMREVTKPKGWMLITVPGINFSHHDFPSDYYRFTEEALGVMFEGFKDVHIETYTDENTGTLSVLGYGRKPFE